MRKDVGVHQTKCQKLLYCHLPTVISVTVVTVQYTVTWPRLASDRNLLDAPLRTNCLKNPYC